MFNSQLSDLKIHGSETSRIPYHSFENTLMKIAALALLLTTTAMAVDFNRDVRPVLAQQCFTCHGMDDHGRKGKLRLDLSDSA